jgi:uncharacterized protein
MKHLAWAGIFVCWMGLAMAAANAQPATPSSAAHAAGLTPGQGAGYHDPRSPFKPLQEKDGVVSWSVLSAVTLRKEVKALVPVFPASVQSLHDKVVRIQGFMMPLEPGDKQRHFLLSAVPTSCNFCVPAGPEGLIEIRSRTPVKYTLEPVLVQGRLAVLPQDPYGLYYRIIDAQPLSP